VNLASEWARRHAEAGPRPKFEVSMVNTANVADDGRIQVGGIFTQEQAIMLAYWILETCGEGVSGAPAPSGATAGATSRCRKGAR
jgi:hypothetical protein